jgi:hypothetical protein
MSYPLSDQILSYAQGQPEGTLLIADALQDLGDARIIAQALKDLTAHGVLFQIEEGIHVLPQKSRFSASGLRAPNLDLVLAAYKAQRGETITTTSAASANIMGLSTQVPAKPIYLTSGASRHIALGGYDVELRHAPLWQTALGNSRAGHAVRALVDFGAAHCDEAIASLQRCLDQEDRNQLNQAAKMAPQWVAEALRRLAAVAGTKGETLAAQR